MRILYHHRIASKDGQAVHVEEIIHALREQGHEVLLVGPQWMKTRAFGFEGGFVAALKRSVPRALYEVLELAYNVPAAWRLFRAVRSFRPHVIYERYNLYFVAGAWVSRLLGVPRLLEVNAPLLHERSKFGGIAVPVLARWSERFSWRSADRVLPVTRVLAAIVEAEDVSRSRITVIPNGIDPAKFADALDTAVAQRRLGIQGRIVLGFTGFMREWHGLERLVDVVAGAPDRFLLLVGDGPARRDVERRARELGVTERVRITGIVPREQVAAFVSAFDVALQPDVVEYASPLKLFEYLALGRAVVAPDKPNIREVLVHADNALLFEAADREAMARTVEQLCRDGALRARLGSRARATIDERRLTWSGNADVIAGIADDLVRARKAG